MTMTEMAMSSIKVVEEVMKESVAAYLDNSKSANSEILRRMINVLLHRVSVVIKGLVIALEVPNLHKREKVDILRFRIDELSISDSSHITSYTQALDISYSSMYHLSEKKTAVISSFAAEIFQINFDEKTDILHLSPLSTSKSTALSIPGDTLLHFELCPHPFNFKCAVQLQNINIGLDSPQIAILGSLTQQILDTLGKPPTSQNPNLSNDPRTAKSPNFENQIPSTPSHIPHHPGTPSTDPSLLHIDRPIAAPSSSNASSDTSGSTTSHSPKPSQTPTKPLFEAKEEDDEEDDTFMDVEDDSDFENDSAELLLNPTKSSSPSTGLKPTKEPQSGAPDSQNTEATLKDEISFSTISNDQNLAVDITVNVEFLQMAIAPTLCDNLTSSGSSLGASALASPIIAHSSIPSSVFNLESLAEPSKSNRSFAFVRFMGFQIASRQTSHGDLSIQATLSALAIHERYKITPDKLALVPEGAVSGDRDSNSTYLTYPVLRVHHPHGFGKSKPEGKASGDAYAMRIRHATEHRVPTTSFDMDQISITLPGKLPTIIDKALSDLTEAFKKPSEPIGSGNDLNSESHPTGLQPSPASSLSSLKDSKSLDHSRFRGLVDSSSSSGSSLAVSAASLSKPDANGDSPHLKEEESPPPSKNMVKVGHLFVTVRFPMKFGSESEKLSFPVYRPDFLGVYVLQPSVTMYSTKGGDNTEAPPDSAEFQTISIHLMKGIQDITNLARISPNGSSFQSKRQSGSDTTAVPKPFLKVIANASSMDFQSEAITISRRTKPLSPHSFSNEDQHTMVLDYSRVGTDSIPPSHFHRPHNTSTRPDSPHMHSIGQSTNGTSAQQRPQSPSTSPTASPKFVNRTFDRAPFSAMAAKFEDGQQIPSSMDDETYEAFRTAVLSNSDLAMTITIHEFELKLEKHQCDLIQDLVDSLSEEEGLPQEEDKGEVKPHPMVGIMSPLAIDFRISFASFNLGVEHNEYRFSNVEDTRILFVNQYLRTSKTFVVVQVGKLRLPSVDPIPNSPPIFSKIPDFDTYDQSKVLQVILVTESLSLEGVKHAGNLGSGSGSGGLKSQEVSDQPTSRMTLLVETNRLAIEHRMGERWIGDLSGFFVREGSVDLSRPRTEVLLFAQAKNSSVALRGNIATNKEYLKQNAMPGDPILLFHMEKLVLHSRLIIPSNPLINNHLDFNIRVHTAQLFLIDDKGRVWLKPYEDPHVKTMRQYWLSRGYTPAGYIESLFAKISLNNIVMPNFALDLNLNGIVDTTGDQVYTLLQLLTSLSSPIPTHPTLESSLSGVSLSPTSNEPSNMQNMISSSPLDHSTMDEQNDEWKAQDEEDPMEKVALDAITYSPGREPLRKGQHLTYRRPNEPPMDVTYEGAGSANRAHVRTSEGKEMHTNLDRLSRHQNHEEGEYILVKLSPEQMKQREAELEQQELLRTFKMAKPLTMNPSARFVASPDGSTPSRMPKPIDNYRPIKKAAQLPLFTFVFNLNSESLVWRLREGVSLSDLDPSEGEKSSVSGSAGHSYGGSNHNSSGAATGLYKDYHDVLSHSPAKHVDINLKGLKVLHTSDAMDQTDLLLRVKRFYFTSAMDNSGAKPFIDLDRSALSLGPYMLTLRLSKLYDLQQDSAPALRPTGLGVSHAGSSRPPSNHQQASSSNSPHYISSKGDQGNKTDRLKQSINSASQSPSDPNLTNKSRDNDALGSILVFSTLPLSIRVDIEALDFVRSFYNTFETTMPQGPPQGSLNAQGGGKGGGKGVKGGVKGGKGEGEKSGGPYFHRVSISSISLNLNVSAWAVRMDDAVIKLPSIYSRGVEGWDGIGSELSDVYSPLLYSSLFTFAGALPVVRLVTSILGSVSNLVINPYHEYRQGRSAAAGAYGAVTVGATSVASEMLRFGAWVTSTAGDGLQYLESFWRTPDSVRTTAPANVQQGAQLGYSNVARQVAAARDCLVVMPWREYEKTQSILGLVTGVAGAVPLAILKPVIGATHGLSNVMQGASNAIHIPGRTSRDPIPATASLGTSPGPSPSPSNTQSSYSPIRR